MKGYVVCAATHSRLWRIGWNECSYRAAIWFSPEAAITCEFGLDPALALAWVTQLLYVPLPEITPSGYIGLLCARRDLAAAATGTPTFRRPKPLPAKGRVLIQAAMREATQQNAHWAQVTTPASNTSRQNLGDRFLEQLWESVFGLTNLSGNGLSTLMLLESLYLSLPLAWRVQLQGGKWELYDANAMARRNAFGKAARTRLTPRMAIRLRGVRMTWLIPGSFVKNGAFRLPAAGAKTVADILRVSGATTMKMIPEEAYSALKWRGALGGNVVGFALSVGPQALYDAYNAGLYTDPTNKEKWKDFAIEEASSQSANLAGFGTGVLAGVLLTVGVSLVVGAGATVGAPVAILVGLAAGIAGQTGFNAFGLNERAKEAVSGWLGR
jgi:hypothetical protein